jgi:single-strand DNA-binding protein
VNSVNLIGNLTRDVELKQVGEYAVAKFAIAVNERVKKAGEWTEQANFFEVETWNGAEACAKYLSKGRQVAVSGSLAQDRWEQDGQKRSKVYVKAQRVDFIGPKEQGQAPAPDPFVAKAASALGARVEDADDDIPF